MIKFNQREISMIHWMQERAGREFAFDEFCVKFRKPNPTKYHKQSVYVGFRKLAGKLGEIGIRLERVSPVGRGHKGIFKISEEIKRL